MRIFFGLSDAQLRQTIVSQDLTKAVVNNIGGKGDGAIKLAAVFGGANKVCSGHRRPWKTAEVFLGKGLSQLASSIGAKVHEKHYVTIGHKRGVANARRCYKLIGFPAIIGGV